MWVQILSLLFFMISRYVCADIVAVAMSLTISSQWSVDMWMQIPIAFSMILISWNADSIGLEINLIARDSSTLVWVVNLVFFAGFGTLSSPSSSIDNHYCEPLSVLVLHNTNAMFHDALFLQVPPFANNTRPQTSTTCSGTLGSCMNVHILRERLQSQPWAESPRIVCNCCH